jgi:hypothetical protein
MNKPTAAVFHPVAPSVEGLTPADAGIARPLAEVVTVELMLELHLRAGPRFKCTAKDCSSYEDAPDRFDCCPACGRKGSLTGGFVLHTKGASYSSWLRRTAIKYRGEPVDGEPSNH